MRALASSAGTPVSVYPADVRDPIAMRQAAADFVSTHGVPQIVIANAGVSIGTDLAHEEDLAVFAEVMDVNLAGIVNTFQPFVKPMIAAREGALVGIASVAGYRGLPGAARLLRVESGGDLVPGKPARGARRSGIRVVTICPGYIETEMTAGNPYRMPFMMSAESAAAKICSVIERRRGFAVIPWQMALVAKLLRLLPNAAFDRMFAGAPRKPRRSSLVGTIYVRAAMRPSRGSVHEQMAPDRSAPMASANNIPAPLHFAWQVRHAVACGRAYSTVTDFARLRGLSTSVPLWSAT